MKAASVPTSLQKAGARKALKSLRPPTLPFDVVLPYLAGLPEKDRVSKRLWNSYPLFNQIFILSLLVLAATASIQHAATFGRMCYKIEAQPHTTQFEKPPGGYLESGDVHNRKHGTSHTPLRGRYELVEFVGKGGMGAVYRARDAELDRSVAVKCLLDVSRESARELALKEARTLASLAHPNIMRVFDIQTVNDQIWIVSEWLEGRSLAQLRLPLPPAAVLAIMTQVYEALAAAHTAQVIHRDVKPANIMVTNDGRVTLIDFGVAFAPGVSTGATLAGSLRYADPRILEGKLPDAAADLFSAALLQVELMTGETVLPELAPLPLYRHIKKNLKQRLDALLDGSYPPLATLARSLTVNGHQQAWTLSANAGVMTAKAAAAISRSALQRLTDKAPEEYLAALFSRNSYTDSAVDAAIAEEAADHIATSRLSPKQKAAWIAFQAATEGDNASSPRQAHKTSARPKGLLNRLPRSLERSPFALAKAKRGVVIDHESQMRLIATLAVLVLMLGGALIWVWFLRDSPASATQAVGFAPVASAADPDPLLGLEPDKATDEAWSEVKQSNQTNELDEQHQGYRAAPQSDANAADLVPLHLAANAWAAVIIDGQEVGKLPQAAPFLLPPGQHVLRLENPSVQALAVEIYLEPDTPQKLHFNLKPKVTPRRLKLASPGHLFIDGVDHGVVTAKTISLTYGTHDIWIKRGQRIVKQQSLALGPDSPKEIALE